MFAKLKSIREEQESGFTLIELLVVILIIGILAAIAIPMFLNQRKSAVDSQVQSDVKNAATQIETWMVKNPSTAVPTVGTTAAPVNQAAVNAVAGLDTIKLSNGTLITVIAGSAIGTYRICGVNAGGDQSSAAATKAVLYDSTSGGLKSGVACA